MTPASALPEALAGGGLLAALAALAGGLASSINPCGLATVALLVSLAANYAPAAETRPASRRLLLWSLAFAAGTVVAFTALGVAAAQAGLRLGLMSPRWYWLIAAVTAGMGLQLLGVLPSFQWSLPARPGPAPPLLPLLLGGLATVVLSPCATPLLVAVWSLAASRGGAEAVWLLGLYGLGRAVPLVLVGVSGELLQRPLARASTGWWRSWGRLAAGAAVLLLSLYFLYLGA